MIYTHVAAAIGGAVLAGALAWNIQGWRLGEEINGIKAQHAAESSKAQADTRAKEIAFNQKLQDAQNEATKRENKLRADADTARRTADGLRGTLYEFRASLPSASTGSLVARADTAAELLGACVSEYRGVAEAADRHAGDALMLQQAWPSQPR